MIPGELYQFLSIDNLWRENILWHYERHCVKPVTLNRYVAEYEGMWKLIVEFLTQFQGRGIKIDRVNSTRVAKSMIFFNI